MATVNFSVPEDVKELFNSAFSGKNRSAIIARLMRDAAEHELALQRRSEAVAAVMQERALASPISADTVREALEELRR